MRSLLSIALTWAALSLLASPLASAAPAPPLVAPAPAQHLSTGAFLLVPPGDAVQSRVFATLAFQVGSTLTTGWGHVTSSRGGLLLGGEWAVPSTGGLALGGSLSALELLDDHVDVPPAIDEHHTRVDLGVTRIYARYLVGDSTTRRGRWMPGGKHVKSQLSAYLRFTLPTATSVLSRQRHPRPPLRDALGDGVNEMRWGAMELGASFGMVLGRYYSFWLAYTPFIMAIVPQGAEYPFFQAVHLHNVFRLPWQMPGKGSFELLLELAGLFRFPGRSDATLYPGQAYLGLNPGMRYVLPRWAFSVGAKIGFGDWASMGDRYTVGLEAAYVF